MPSSFGHISNTYTVNTQDTPVVHENHHDKKHGQMAALNPSQPPPDFTSFTPDSIVKETASILAQSNAIRDQITTAITPATATFSNVVRPLVDDQNRAACRLNILGTLLAEASPDPLIRDASRQCQQLILAAQSEALMRRDLAALVCAIYGRSLSDHGDQLDAQDRHLLGRMRGEFLRSGATLQSDEKRHKLQAAQAELHELRIAAQKTIADSSGGGVWFQRDELAGMSPNVLDGLETRKDADEQGRDQTTYLVTFKDQHMTQMSTWVQSGAARRKYKVMYRRRFPENVPRLARIVVLRDEIARELGFSNHATMKMEELMARSVDDIQATLHTLWRRLEPIAKAEDEKLLALKRLEASPNDDAEHVQLHEWDWSYYAKRFKAQNGAFNQEKLSEFFEIRHTWTSTLRLFEKLFQVRFHDTTGSSSVWHDSVRVYSVWDSHGDDGLFLGYLYVDLFERDGKYQNQHHVLIEPSFITADGSHNHPSSALVCSFPTPSPTKPTLLDHFDVCTLFHELGHCIHNIVSTTKYAIPHSRDYIEIPSVLLEYWGWEPKVLTAIGLYNTCRIAQEGRSDGLLPKNMMDSLLAVRGCFGANAMLSLIQRAVFDLAIHSPRSRKDAIDMDITKLWNTTRRDMAGQSGDPDDWGWEQAAFGHIFRKYDAGFFAYPIARAYASDLYSTLFADDPLDPERVRSFRQQVLQVGSSVPETSILEGFLGRRLDVEALLGEIIQHSCSQW